MWCGRSSPNRSARPSRCATMATASASSRMTTMTTTTRDPRRPRRRARRVPPSISRPTRWARRRRICSSTAQAAQTGHASRALCRQSSRLSCSMTRICCCNARAPTRLKRMPLRSISRASRSPGRWLQRARLPTARTIVGSQRSGWRVGSKIPSSRRAAWASPTKCCAAPMAAWGRLCCP